MSESPHTSSPDADARTTRASMLSGMRHSKADERRKRCRAEFFKAYWPRFCTFFRKKGIGEHDAEDLAGDLVTALIKQMDEFVYDPSQCFWSYLQKCASRGLARFWEKNERRKIAVGVNVEELGQRLIEQFDRDLLEEAKEQVRARISPWDWEIFERRQAGQKPEAIAKAFDTTRGAVYEASRRVKKELQAELERIKSREMDED